MPAYLAMVESDEGYVGGVYFTPQAIHARRAVCDYWQDGELGGSVVKRMPHFDKYEERGAVPMRDMMYEHWWSECYECGVKLTIDEQYDEDDNEFVIDAEQVVGDFGGPTFCCQEHADAWYRKRDTKRAMRDELLNMMQAKVESKLGVEGISYCEHFQCDVNWLGDVPFVRHACLNFMVPGSKYAMSYTLRDEQGTGDPTYEMTYNPYDHDAVAAFFLERTGRVLDKPDSLD